MNRSFFMLMTVVFLKISMLGGMARRNIALIATGYARQQCRVRSFSTVAHNQGPSDIKTATAMGGITACVGQTILPPLLLGGSVLLFNEPLDTSFFDSDNLSALLSFSSGVGVGAFVYGARWHTKIKQYLNVKN